MPFATYASIEPPLALALDVGSSSARAMLFDAKGRSCEGWEARRPYTLTATDDGGSEVDADALLALVGDAIDELLARIGAAAASIVAVGVSTFWHSLVGVDGEGGTLTPVLTWADTRASAAAARLREVLDETSVHARTGAVLHPSYLPAKLAWLREARPDVFRRAARWMSFGEYLGLRLFGRALCGVSMASGTGLFDQNRLAWDDEILAAVGIDAEKLSPLASEGEALVGLHEPYASRWPALAAVPWFPALGDGACSNVGAGCANATANVGRSATNDDSFDRGEGASSSRVALVVGTSGAMRVVVAADRVEIPRGLWAYRLDRRRFVVGGALSEGGNLFAWLDHLLALEPGEALEHALATYEPDAHGLTILPFVAGERSVGWAANARAAFVGMSLDTKPVDVMRASLEAIAYRFALVAERLAPYLGEDTEVVASGGALLHSPAWVQIMADVLGRPVRESAESEGSSRGAALVALESVGAIADVGAVPAAFGKTYEPDPARFATYRAAAGRQRELYELLISGPGTGGRGTK